MSKFNQFDFEQQIMDCWSVCEDLQTAADTVEEGTSAHAILVGLRHLYHAKFEKLFDIFEDSLVPKRLASLMAAAEAAELEVDEDEYFRL